MKSIQYCSEGYETKERLTEFFISGSDTTESFDTGEKVFDHVPVLIESFRVVVFDSAGLAGRNTWSCIAFGQGLPESFGIESAVTNDPATSKLVNESLDRSEVMPVAGNQIQSHRSANAVDDHRQFCVRSAFGHPDRLQFGAAGRIGSVLMDFDVGAIDTPNGAASVSCEQGEHLRPLAGTAPTAETRIDRRPRTKLCWQISPGHSCPQDIVNAVDHEPVVLRRPAADPLCGDTSRAIFIRSIFLAGPIANPAKPNDLDYS